MLPACDRRRGQPVAGATVTLWVLNFTTYAERVRGTTDASGHFSLLNMESHNIQLTAEKAGIGRSRRVPVRLFSAPRTWTCESRSCWSAQAKTGPDATGTNSQSSPRIRALASIAG